MTDPFANWPPIIHSAKRSRLIFWRDAILTALMWGLMFVILYSELAFALSALEVLLGRSEAEIDAELDIFIRRMRPLLLLIGGLVVMLAIATLVSRHRRTRALEAPQPQPLDDAERASIAGMDEAALTAAESMKRVVVGRNGTALIVSDAP
jgi:poly-beta-1,6-N-acetyl-D-glucosamine biosynthesis protein PgaD